MNYENLYVTKKFRKNSGLEQLIQLLRIVWDGDLISKDERNKLVELGLAVRANGFNIITPEGIDYLKKAGVIHE